MIDVNPIPLSVPNPFGGSPSPTVNVPESLGIAQTNPDPCADWANGVEPLPPPPPPFEVTADWAFPGIPSTPTGGLLDACVTVQGVLPRTCVNV